MSQENAEIVQRSVQALMRGDYAAAFEDFSPTTTFEMASGVDPAGMQSAYEGHEGLRQFHTLLVDVFAHHEIEIEELRDHGDDVFGVCRERGVGRLSGVVVDRRLYNIWTVIDGKLVRTRTYLNKDEALKAVGLEE